MLHLGDGQGSEQWSSEDKFLIVMETYTMNEAELAEYCGKKDCIKSRLKLGVVIVLNANGQEFDQTKQLN